MAGLYHVGAHWPSKLADAVWYMGRSSSALSERFGATRRELSGDGTRAA